MRLRASTRSARRQVLASAQAPLQAEAVVLVRAVRALARAAQVVALALALALAPEQALTRVLGLALALAPEQALARVLGQALAPVPAQVVAAATRVAGEEQARLMAQTARGSAAKGSATGSAKAPASRGRSAA